MTRKRFVKLCMAKGLSRNDAKNVADECKNQNLTYDILYAIISVDDDFMTSFWNAVNDMFSEVSKTVNRLADALENLSEKWPNLPAP